jgi:hypothetical protein
MMGCASRKSNPISLDWLICGAERSSRGEHEAPTPITSKA